jgi:GTP-binding protein
MGNIVAIVGRPNVGKSTLFNRLTKSRRAIVNEQAGTTRDRQYGKSEWNGREFSVIDTGGWVINSNDVFEEQIKHHVKLAIEEADVILFLVDIQNGITDYDLEVAQILRGSKKPVLLVSNKADTFDWQYNAAEFYKLGLGDPLIVSAINGLGTGDLLDKILTYFHPESNDEVEEELPSFAVVGRSECRKIIAYQCLYW